MNGSNRDRPTTAPNSTQTALMAQVEDTARALAQNDVRALERAQSPYRHRLPIRMLLHASAQDPRCSPISSIPVAISILIGFLISGAWQIAAIYIAAKYELDVPVRAAAIGAGVAVAILVVSFDWDIVYKRIRGQTRSTMLAVRIVFVLIMALLVSEAVAGWVFDKDIRSTVAVHNTTLQRQIAQRQSADADRLADLEATLKPYRSAVTVEERRVSSDKKEIARQREGVLGAKTGEGKLWLAAKVKLGKDQADLDGAERALATQEDLVAGQKNEILTAQQAFLTSRQNVDADSLGPGEREHALWTYLLSHPDALWLRRIPLAIVLVVLDLFAVIIGWSVGASIRERHQEWSEQLKKLRTRSDAMRSAVLASSEERASAMLDAVDRERRQQWPDGGDRPVHTRTTNGHVPAYEPAFPDPYQFADPEFRPRRDHDRDPTPSRIDLTEGGVAPPPARTELTDEAE